MSRLHQRPRVVFDTAVVLRALLLNDSKSKQLRRAWQTAQCQALVTTGSAQVLMKALSYPAFKLDEAQQLELLADFLPYAEVVDGQGLAGAEAGQTAWLALAACSAAAVAPSLDHVVSDCPQLRSASGSSAKPLKKARFSLLGSEELLARLL